jgi:two-component system, chemotaxis family, sensor kinase CheA
MNEFIAQFLLESRELIEQATDDLLTLEGHPNDRERIDSAFRAFHTLKGAAGIVEFAAMARALHAAEDVLAEVRAGAEPVTAELISNGLTCLDQVVQWLDAMQEDGEIPLGADAAAEALVRRFSAPSKKPAAPPQTGDWSETLAARHPNVGATIAIRYRPDAEAFFRGEDPLAILSRMPGLAALEIVKPEAWPPLGELDPFLCRLSFLALAICSLDEARSALQAVASQIEIAPLSPVEAGASGVPETARALLEAQRRLLDSIDTEAMTGRTASAGRVAANVMRSLGRLSDADRLEDVLDPDGLAAAIRSILDGGGTAALAEEVGAVEAAPAEAAARTLRVDVERIDALVNLTGELLVAKNALGHAAALAQGGADAAMLAGVLKDQHGVLQRLVDQLQRSVLNIRVLPMRYVFQRFPRLVREMVVNLGKPAHLATEGEDTEADKAIVEGLFEPILHVLRNALDHGVEPAAVRAAANKPAGATIVLRAARRGDHLVVEIEDDGGGIDVERVRTVAATREIASADALAAMGDKAVVNLIFTPGFSTAAQVTSLSGRGVGMDAVRTAVERLGGHVAVESKSGLGTLVRFTLPFAVMMTRVLTVEAGGELFGVPLESVLETVRLSRDDISAIGAATAFVHRGRTIPLIDLADALGEGRRSPSNAQVNVVIAVAGGQVGGLEVDRLGERMDVMLKPMGGLLAGMPGLSGTTLLGDGRVLIVLDLHEFLQ